MSNHNQEPSMGELLPCRDISFARPGARFGTRAGWTVELSKIEGWRWQGYMTTDAGTSVMFWLPDGRAEHAADDIVEVLHHG